MLAPVSGQTVSACQSELAENPCEGFMEDKCGKPSTIKVVGESDSFGSEYYYQCRECRDKQIEWEKENPTLSDCEWCKAQNVKTSPIRDIDEGSHGPQYDVCGPCRTKYYDRFREENEARDDDDDLYFDEPDDVVLMGVIEVDILDANKEPLHQQLFIDRVVRDGKFFLVEDVHATRYWTSITEAKAWVAELGENVQFIYEDGSVWKKDQLHFSCLEHTV